MEDALPGVGGHDRRLAVDASGRQRDQAAPLALPLVGDELVHVLGRQHPRVVAAGGSVQFQEGAQFQTGSAHVVEGASAAWAAGRTQDRGQVVPDQVAQPSLGDAGEVHVDRAAGELAAEVLGEDVSALTRLGWCHVEGAQPVGHGPHDVDRFAADRLVQKAFLLGARVRQRPQTVPAGEVHQALPGNQFPAAVRLPGVGEHAPLDLGPQQRMQPPKVDLRGPQHRHSARAPALEGALVVVADRRDQPSAPVAVAPL